MKHLFIVNPAAGKGKGPITMAEIDAALGQGMLKVRRVLQQLLGA